MNFFHHKDLGNHLLQLCPKVVKHPVYAVFILYMEFKSNFASFKSEGVRDVSTSTVQSTWYV